MQQMITEMDIARLAMAIDCEGCIAIVKHRSANSRIGYAYVLKVQVTNSSLILADWVNYHFGGSMFSKLTSKRKRYFDVVFNGKEAAEVLTTVLPYLLIKEEQAMVALEFQATVGNNGNRSFPLPSSIIAIREQLHLKLKELKIVPIVGGQDG